MTNLLRSHPLFTRTKTIARYRSRTVVQRLRRILVVMMILRTLQEMSDDDATHMAAAISYYALVSLFPLTLGIISIMSLIHDAPSPDLITNWVTSFLPGSENLVKVNIESVLAVRGTIGVLAVCGLFWAGSAIFWRHYPLYKQGVGCAV